MKRALIIILLAIVVIGAALPFAPVDFLKTPIEGALARGLGRKVEVDQVSLTLFSGPGVSLDGVTIHEDSRAGLEPFAYANTLDARINLLALLRGRLEFSSLDLNDATFNLVKPAGAPWNFQMLLSQTIAAGHTASPPAGMIPVGPALPVIPATLPSIKMRGGRVNFKFADTKSVLYFDDTDLEVAPREGGAVELRFSGVPSRTDQGSLNFGHFYVRGNATPSAAGQQFNFQVELEPSALEAVARLRQQRRRAQGAGRDGCTSDRIARQPGRQRHALARKRRRMAGRIQRQAGSRGADAGAGFHFASRPEYQAARQHPRSAHHSAMGNFGGFQCRSAGIGRRARQKFGRAAALEGDRRRSGGWLRALSK
jgi:hypothetical protein